MAIKSRKANNKDETKRVGLIEAITAPLGFFVLALLIVESFLATVLIGANLPEAEKITGMWAGIGMFVLVIVAVFILDWFKPSNLTYDKQAHLIDRGKVPFGSDGEKVNPNKLFSPQEKESEK